MLSAEKLRLEYGKTLALVDASVAASPGEIIAVIGNSGCGKTSLLYCLAGLLQPNSGIVRFNGKSINSMSEEKRSELRRRHFGFVFQFADLIPELTLRENVALPLELNGVRGKQQCKRVTDLFDRLGIYQHADRRPAQVSGGQVQRAAVARALVHRPTVIFADEPTGALDSHSRQRVLQEFLDLARESNSSVVMVTHDTTVAEAADRMVLMRDGVTSTAAG